MMDIERLRREYTLESLALQVARLTDELASSKAMHMIEKTTLLEANKNLNDELESIRRSNDSDRSG
jgi:hypothetical protein